ncbi:MAG: hypothetical protein ABI671_19035 [Burkholderiales bacterium]
MRLALAVLTTALALPAFAKLPPPSDEAKAKAAEAALKTAWSGKVAGYQLCKAMNKAAAAYQANAKMAGKAPAAPVATPPCADPGAFVSPAATPPLEAAGAHSPATTTGAPPSSKATSAELKPAPKK